MLLLFVGLAAILFAIGYFRLRYNKEVIRQTNKELEKKEQDLKKSIQDLLESHNQFSQSIVVLQNQRQEIEESMRREALSKKLQVEESIREFEVNEKTKIENVLERVAEHSEWSIREFLAKYEKYKEYVRQQAETIEENLQDAAAKYVATISTYKQLDLEAQELSAYMIQLSENDRQDMSYLIQEVVPKIHNPQLLNKLIWTEYVMKPTNELLKRILPSKECSGIYKITYIPNKKSYIGRSTSVYKRLQEHIKSSLGVGTIADQWVHHEMRDKGIENFTFELIEECDKDKLSEREKYYIGFFQTDSFGYNRNIGG